MIQEEKIKKLMKQRSWREKKYKGKIGKKWMLMISVDTWLEYSGHLSEHPTNLRKLILLFYPQPTNPRLFPWLSGLISKALVNCINRLSRIVSWQCLIYPHSKPFPTRKFFSPLESWMMQTARDQSSLCPQVIYLLFLRSHSCAAP